MPKRFKIVPEVKQQLLERIKQGGSITDIATEHGISPKTIYGWLSKGATAAPTWMDYNRLKKENHTLMTLIGELTLKMTVVGKKGTG